VPVAVFVIDPASISTCVTISVAVQVRTALGVNPPAGSAGQVTVAILSSVTVIGSVSVTLPVFVIT